MTIAVSAMTRRRALAAAGAGVALVPGVAAFAQSAPPGIWHAAYTAHKGTVELAVYRKRVGAPKAGEVKKPV